MAYLTDFERDVLKLDEATAIAFDRQRMRGIVRDAIRRTVVLAFGYDSLYLREFDRDQAVAIAADGPRVTAGWEYVDPRRGLPWMPPEESA